MSTANGVCRERLGSSVETYDLARLFIGWYAYIRRNALRLLRPTRCFTVMNWWRTGNWPSAAKIPIKSPRCEVAMYWDVTAVKPLSGYRLYVEIADGRKGIFDVTPYLEIGVFRELKNINYFNQVGILFGAVTWPNEQDIAPETLLAGMRPVEAEAG